MKTLKKMRKKILVLGIRIPFSTRVYSQFYTSNYRNGSATVKTSLYLKDEFTQAMMRV